MYSNKNENDVFLLKKLGFVTYTDMGGAMIQLEKNDKILLVSQINDNDSQEQEIGEDEDDFHMPCEKTRNIRWTIESTLRDNDEYTFGNLKIKDFAEYEKEIKNLINMM